jgi:cysteine desulfurase
MVRKGIGALYVLRHCPVPLEPLIIGGAQQNGLRAGTVPTFLCVGLGEVCRIAAAELETDKVHSLRLRDAFLSALKRRFPDMAINGDPNRRLPGNLNVQLPGIDADSLLTTLQGKLAASTGSACNAGLIEPSYVLTALGLSLDQVNSSIRFGFGRFTSLEEVEGTAELLAEKAAALRTQFAYS